MSVELWLAQWQAKWLHFVESLSPSDRYYLWAGSGAMILLLCLWVSYRVMRKAFGHRKFRGTWLDEQQFEALITMIDEDSKRGSRVMKHDEMQLLRKWRFGSAKSISDRAKGGYF